MAPSLRRSSSWQFVQSLASTGTELLVLLILAARLSAEAFGLLAVLLGAAKIGYLIAEIRIHEFLSPKLARYAVRHPSAAAAWTRLSVRLELTCNGLGLLLCFGAALVGDALGVLGEPWLLLACGAYLGSNTVLKFSSLAILRYVGRVELAAWHALAGAAAKLSALACALYFGLTTSAIMATMAVPSLLISLRMARVARRALRQAMGEPRVQPATGARLSTRNLRRQGSLLVANYATGFAEIGHRELDVQILAALAGATVAGGYRLAKSLSMVMLEALSPLVLILLPEFSRRLGDRDRSGLFAFARRMTLVLAGMGWVSALVVLGASSLYLAWFAPAQWEILGVVAVLVAGLAAMAPAMWAQSFLVASGRPQAYLRASLAGAAVAALTTWLAAGAWGAAGAAVGHVAGLWIANGLAMHAAWGLLPRSDSRPGLP